MGKEKGKNILLIVLITTLVMSFLLFFLGYYRIGFAIGAIFMILSLSVGQWYSLKSKEELYRSTYKDRQR